MLIGVFLLLSMLLGAGLIAVAYFLFWLTCLFF
jgi:hypothetical protein